MDAFVQVVELSGEGWSVDIHRWDCLPSCLLSMLKLMLVHRVRCATMYLLCLTVAERMETVWMIRDEGLELASRWCSRWKYRMLMEASACSSPRTHYLLTVDHNPARLPHVWLAIWKMLYR